MENSNKSYHGKKLAILTGGGDTPALNSSIEAIQREAEQLGFEVLGIRRGWKGLLGEGDLVKLTGQQIDPWYGGTVLRSSRTNPFKGNEKIKSELYQNLKDYHIDVLVVIGGDDTVGAAKKLYQEIQFPVIAFPKTIDNDLRTGTMLHTDKEMKQEVVLCPGFATAVDGVADYFNRLKTYALSHERVLVTEVMGRDAGWLAASATLAGADFVLIPEVYLDEIQQQRFIRAVQEKYRKAKNGFLTIAVAEGVKWFDSKAGRKVKVESGQERDEFGHVNVGGISDLIANDIKNELGVPAKGVVSGFYVRSGKCGSFDRKLTQVLAQRLKLMIENKQFGQMPMVSSFGENHDLSIENTGCIQLEDVGNVPLPITFYDQQQFNVNDDYKRFMHQISDRRSQKVFDVSFSPVSK